MVLACRSYTKRFNFGDLNENSTHHLEPPRLITSWESSLNLSSLEPCTSHTKLCYSLFRIPKEFILKGHFPPPPGRANDYFTIQSGCATHLDTHLTDASFNQCGQGAQLRDHTYDLVKCCSEPLCNNASSLLTFADLIEIFTLQRPLFTTTPSNHLSSSMLFIFAILLFVLLVVVLALVGFNKLRHYRKHAKRWNELGQHPDQFFSAQYTANARAPAGDEQLPALEQPSVESSARTQSTELNGGAVSFPGGGIACTSGAGTGALHTRTLAHDVIIGERVGKGRSGEVWCASWKHYRVAVKSFAQVDYALWEREVRLYQLGLNHRNLLTYRAHDVISDPASSSSFWWIVTDYYPRGSLYKELVARPIESVEQCVRMLLDIAAGLEYLHTEVANSSGLSGGKPEIAHRDLKSKNVLVADNGTCCIADLGLAVQMDTSSKSCRAKLNGEPIRVGTLRYMAPEVMSNRLDSNAPFSSFLLADVYALALVAWEMLQRTRLPPARGTRIAGCTATAASGENLRTSDIESKEYSASASATSETAAAAATASPSTELDPPYLEPYFDVLPACSAEQPDALDVMLEHVVERSHRPPLEHLVGRSPVVDQLVRTLIPECWSAVPSVRWPANAVRDELSRLLDSLAHPSVHSLSTSHT